MRDVYRFIRDVTTLALIIVCFILAVDAWKSIVSIFYILILARMTADYFDR